MDKTNKKDMNKYIDDYFELLKLDLANLSKAKKSKRSIN